MLGRFKSVDEVKISTVDRRALRDIGRTSAFHDGEFCGFLYGRNRGHTYLVDGLVPVFGKPYETETHKGIYVDGVFPAIKSFNRQFPGFVYAYFHTHPNVDSGVYSDQDVKSSPIGGLEMLISCSAARNGNGHKKGNHRSTRFYGEDLSAFKTIKENGRKIAVELEVKRL